MILKRVSTAFRAKDWGAVAIEFAIVVLGIFVALQAEDWNQGRRDRQLERIYIARLIEETRANLALLTAHEQIYEDKIHFIFDLPGLDLEQAVRKDPRAFVLRLDNSSYIQIPDMRSETYQELESAGRLSLIRDAHLRGAIASNLNDYRSTRPVFVDPIGDYRRILFETLPGRSIYEFRVGSGAADTDAIVASIQLLRTDPRFAAAANAEIAYGSDVLFWVREFKGRTEEILSMLEANE